MSKDSNEGSRILVVCGGNTCRSPMAEGIAKRLVGSSAHVESAGVDAADGSPPTQEALFVMKELGIDISGHRARDIENLQLTDYDIIVAMTPTIASQLSELGVDASRIIRLQVDDPYGKGLGEYWKTAAKLAIALPEILGISERRRGPK